MTLGVRGCVIDAEGRVLLIRHSYTPGWHFPAAGSRSGRRPSTRWRPKLREEANVILTGEPVFAGLFLNARTSRRDHVVLYRIDGWTQPAPFTPTREILEARFFARDALPEGVTRGTRERSPSCSRERRAAPIGEPCGPGAGSRSPP